MGFVGILHRNAMVFGSIRIHSPVGDFSRSGMFFMSLYSIWLAITKYQRILPRYRRENTTKSHDQVIFILTVCPHPLTTAEFYLSVGINLH